MCHKLWKNCVFHTSFGSTRICSYASDIWSWSIFRSRNIIAYLFLSGKGRNVLFLLSLRSSSMTVKDVTPFPTKNKYATDVARAKYRSKIDMSDCVRTDTRGTKRRWKTQFSKFMAHFWVIQCSKGLQCTGYLSKADDLQSSESSLEIRTHISDDIFMLAIP